MNNLLTSFYANKFDTFINIYSEIDLLTFIKRTLININYLESLLKIIKPNVTIQTEYNDITRQLLLYRQIIKQSEKYKKINFRTAYLYQLFNNIHEIYVSITDNLGKTTNYISNNKQLTTPKPVLSATESIKNNLNEIYDNINNLISTYLKSPSMSYNIKNFNVLLNKLNNYNTFSVSNEEEINKLIDELLLIANKYNSNKLSYIIPRRILLELKKAYKNTNKIPGDILYKLYVLLSKIELKTKYIISTKKYF